MRIFNPCKKCLVKPICSTTCTPAYEYGVFKNQMDNIFGEIYRSFRWAITDRTKRSVTPKIMIIIFVLEIVFITMLIIRDGNL